MTNVTAKLPVWDSVSNAWHKVSGAKGSLWGALGLMFLIFIGCAIIGGIASAIFMPLGLLISIIQQILLILLMAGLMYMGLERAQDRPITYTMVLHTLDWNLGFKVIIVYILKMLIMLPFILFIMAVSFFGAISQLIVAAFQHVQNKEIITNINHVSANVTQVNATVISHANQAADIANKGVSFIPASLAMILCLIAVIAGIFIFVRLALTLAFLLEQNAGIGEAFVLSFRATRGNVWRLIGLYIVWWFIMVISMIPLGIGLIWTFPLSYIIYGMIYKALMVNANNPIVKV